MGCMETHTEERMEGEGEQDGNVFIMPEIYIYIKRLITRWPMGSLDRLRGARLF